MKKAIILTASIFWSLLVFAQKISNVDFDAIEKELGTSSKLYRQLLDRFVLSDTTLMDEDYATLYYGQCYQPDYNPYLGDRENFEKFNKFYQAENFNKALPIALTMISKNPLDMKMTFKAMVCYFKLKNEAGIAALRVRYDNIMQTIIRSGDGKTASTAFVVMCISDEYEIMGNLGVEMTSQSLVGHCDLMTLRKNDLGIEKIYFDITKPFDSMKKLFGK